MANPQIERGHTDIANEVMDALCRFRIPGEVRQVIDAIIRKTWGWHKTHDVISNSQLVAMTGMRKGNVSRAVARAIANKFVIKQDNSYRFNKDYDEWIPFEYNNAARLKVINQDNTEPLTGSVISQDNSGVVINQDTKVINQDNELLSARRDTKEKKETIQKKTPLTPQGEEGKEIVVVMSEDTRKAWDLFEDLICPITTKNKGFERNQLVALVRECGGIGSYEKTLRLLQEAHKDRFAKGNIKADRPSRLRENRGALLAWGKSRYSQQEGKALHNIPGRAAALIKRNQPNQAT